MTTAKTDVKVREIPVEQLVVSPEETRKTIDQAALAELAESIGKIGVTEPLLVRPVDLDCMSGDPLPGAAKAVDAFEIISGQRRWLASKLAGNKSCPCIVRHLNDEEAADIRIISNLQREDLAPMEEAEAYGKLLERPGATIETVAAALAKSPSYVGRRVQLLKAIEPVRQALKAGAIEVGHALLLAPLATTQQETMLAWLQVGWQPEGEEEEECDYDTCRYCEREYVEFEELGYGWHDEDKQVCSGPACVARHEARQRGEVAFAPTRRSPANLRRHIESTQLKVLVDAPWPLDAPLPPRACTECEQRSGNSATLFDDCARDTCMNRECYEAKRKVWVKRELALADDEKRSLLMLSDGYSSERSAVRSVDVAVDGETCESSEQAIWINGDRMGHRATICRDKKCPVHGREVVTGAASSVSQRSGTKAAPVKLSPDEKRRVEAEKAERAKLAEKVKKEREYRNRLFAAIAQVPDEQIDTPRISLLTKQACFRLLSGSGQYAEELAQALGWDREVFDYGPGGNAKLEAKMRGLTLQSALRAAALRLIVDQASVSDWSAQREEKPERMEQMASWLGIDVKAVRSGKATADPSRAAQDDKPKQKAAAKPAVKAPAKKAANAKKPVLSADAKKRIADAQRKRWSAQRGKSAKKGGAK